MISGRGGFGLPPEHSQLKRILIETLENSRSPQFPYENAFHNEVTGAG